MTAKNALQKVFDNLGGHGAGVKIANACGITRTAVYQWEIVPTERVLTVESLSGVSRYELRPDIYGPKPD